MHVSWNRSKLSLSTFSYQELFYFVVVKADGLYLPYEHIPDRFTLPQKKQRVVRILFFFYAVCVFRMLNVQSEMSFEWRNHFFQMVLLQQILKCTLTIFIFSASIIACQRFLFCTFLQSVVQHEPIT